MIDGIITLSLATISIMCAYVYVYNFLHIQIDGMILLG